MKRLLSGDIIEIFIRDIEMYCYCKYVDKRKFYDDISYPFQFRISKDLKKIRTSSPSEIDFSKLLFSPWHLMGHMDLIKNGRWKVIGKQHLSEEDMKQHHYKMEWPPSLISIPSEVSQWRVIKNIDNVNDGIIVSHHQCRHLEYSGNHGALNFEFRIVLEHHKIEGTIDTIVKDNWDKYDHILFARHYDMPVFNSLPVEYQGYLIEE